MIGGGNKIGSAGTTQLPSQSTRLQSEQPNKQSNQVSTSTSTPAHTTTANGPQQGQAAADSFQKNSARMGGQGNLSIASPPPKGPMTSQDMLALARDNPAAAKQLAATLMASMGSQMQRFNTEFAGAQVMLQKLAAKRFSRRALEAEGQSLSSKRQVLTAMKMRGQIGRRKLMMLQQIAGQLSNPLLEEEFEEFLQAFEGLNHELAKQFQALALSQLLSGDPATPKHLQSVYCATVHGHGYGHGDSDGESDGKQLAAFAPKRLLAEVMVRQLDSSTFTSSVITSPSKASQQIDQTLSHWSRLSAGVRRALGKRSSTVPITPTGKSSVSLNTAGGQ